MLIMSICVPDVNMSAYTQPLQSCIIGAALKSLTSTGSNRDGKQRRQQS